MEKEKRFLTAGSWITTLPGGQPCQSARCRPRGGCEGMLSSSRELRGSLVTESSSGPGKEHSVAGAEEQRRTARSDQESETTARPGRFFKSCMYVRRRQRTVFPCRGEGLAFCWVRSAPLSTHRGVFRASTSPSSQTQAAFPSLGGTHTAHTPPGTSICHQTHGKKSLQMRTHKKP